MHPKMYAQNLGSKAVVVMQNSMERWMSQGKMTPEKASSTLAADAAVVRFAIQGGISFAHAGGVAAQHLAMALQKAPTGYQVPNRRELTEWRLPKQLQDEYHNAEQQAPRSGAAAASGKTKSHTSLYKPMPMAVANQECACILSLFGTSAWMSQRVGP